MVHRLAVPASVRWRLRFGRGDYRARCVPETGLLTGHLLVDRIDTAVLGRVQCLSQVIGEDVDESGNDSTG